MELSLRLEIFRRINEGGTPLSGQDIRLGYYSQARAVRFIQAVGIVDPAKAGAKRIIEDVGYDWPWASDTAAADLWKDWWSRGTTSFGQTASETFLWSVISNHRKSVEAILNAADHLTKNLRLRFRGNTEEVLDIVCAQLRFEEAHPDEPKLMPTLETLKENDFPLFSRWWFQIRQNCGPSANVSKNRAIALLIPALGRVYGAGLPTPDQWTMVAKFLRSIRETARDVLKIEFPEPKGKWRSQRAQLEAFDEVARKISTIK